MPPSNFRRRLLAPLVYLAALVLLLEQWLWDAGARVLRRLSRFGPLRALERAIAGLPPYGALALFVLPGVLLLPVKLLALLLISQGHPWPGIGLILAAKAVGAAVVGRLYALTRPALLALPWFARWHNAFIELKNRWIGRLRATQAWRRVHALKAALGAMGRAWRAALRR